MGTGLAFNDIEHMHFQSTVLYHPTAYIAVEFLQSYNTELIAIFIIGLFSLLP